jgi:hypothetical protein
MSSVFDGVKRHRVGEAVLNGQSDITDIIGWRIVLVDISDSR